MNIKDRIPVLNFDEPNSTKLDENTMDSLVENIKIALLNNYEIGDISEFIQNRINELEFEQKTPVIEKYDDLGNAIVKLVNLGYSVSLGNGDLNNLGFSFSDFFDGLKELDYKKVNSSKLPNYDGPEIEHCSILASTFNISQSFKNIPKYEKEGMERIITILGKCFQYGCAAFGQIVSDYRDDLNELKREFSEDDPEYLVLTMAYVFMFKNK
ncbi:MAG: hypothetical protein SLAVMIC_00187 [uncultured marine phage]|uniref:Uncharacterized protein n=1 Tax=uncultured marine phage TaxID=707152 RepID=A0A8D9CCM1_9VIRU|nr:MAG: hypothetical protein SLAVMIC_00187 [uncultured marine phage]